MGRRNRELTRKLGPGAGNPGGTAYPPTARGRIGSAAVAAMLGAGPIRVVRRRPEPDGEAIDGLALFD